MDDILKDSYFRINIFGKTGSGKTYCLLNFIIPKLKDKYNEIVVFTKSHNNTQYNRKIKEIFKIAPYIINKNFKVVLNKIKDIQEKNITGEDEDGHPIYGTNILLIWDDILDETLFKDQDFLDQFTNMRHLQCSIIVISQMANKTINTQMKANTSMFIYFKLTNEIQRREALNMLKESIMMSSDKVLGEKEAKNKAQKLWNKCVQKKKYGFIIITDDGSTYCSE
jgi:vacuolar-type H+-ATPase subunit F/Vma7